MLIYASLDSRAMLVPWSQGLRSQRCLRSPSSNRSAAPSSRRSIVTIERWMLGSPPSVRLSFSGMLCAPSVVLPAPRLTRSRSRRSRAIRPSVPSPTGSWLRGSSNGVPAEGVESSTASLRPVRPFSTPACRSPMLYSRVRSPRFRPTSAAPFSPCSHVLLLPISRCNSSRTPAVESDLSTTGVIRAFPLRSRWYFLPRTTRR
jgi:hypothetical protein